MKRKEITQLHNKPVPEIEKNLASLREELWGMQRDLAAGKVTNVRKIRSVKKDIARLLTVKNAQ